MDVPGWLKADSRMNEDQIRERCVKEMQENYDAKVEAIGASLMRLVEKEIMLKQLDFHWKEHLGAMDYLRQGVGLRSYAQKESETGIQARSIRNVRRTCWNRSNTTRSASLSRVRIQSEQDVQRHGSRTSQGTGDGVPARRGAVTRPGTDTRWCAAVHRRRALHRSRSFGSGRKVGRNEACPCGSGKSTNSATASLS